MKAIINANIILENSILQNGIIIIENGRIAYIGNSTCKIPKDAEIIDADGAYAAPGFVDIHVHGGGGFSFSNDPEKAAAYFLEHGETTVLATLYTDLDRDGYIEAINRVRSAMKDGKATNLAGIYMEGPYMNPKYGSMPDQNKWRGPISDGDYIPIVDTAGKDARVWAVAPERDGLEAFLSYAKKVNPNAMISVAHSEATPEQVYSLKKYGLGLQTHTMNATGRPKTLSGTRSCGPDEACLGDKDIYAEVICDSLAIHVHADMLRFIMSIKTPEKIVLITDGMANNEPNPPELSHINDLSFDDKGDLCGSKLTMDAVCRNMIKHTDCTLNELFWMVSRNPARVIGSDSEIGTIEVGKKANIILLDKDLYVHRVICE